MTLSSWRCLTCPDGAEAHDAGLIDKAAEKHTKATQHATVTSHQPSKDNR